GPGLRRDDILSSVDPVYDHLHFHRPIRRPGSHVVSGGHSVLAASTTISGIRNGTIARAMRSNDMRAIFDTTYSTTPTGGVTVPIMRLSTKTSPKCTGSMPR